MDEVTPARNAFPWIGRVEDPPIAVRICDAPARADFSSGHRRPLQRARDSINRLTHDLIDSMADAVRASRFEPGTSLKLDGIP
jgi:hypothetical protein